MPTVATNAGMVKATIAEQSLAERHTGIFSSPLTSVFLDALLLARIR
jgi:hypothetical protein